MASDAAPVTAAPVTAPDAATTPAAPQEMEYVVTNCTMDDMDDYLELQNLCFRAGIGEVLFHAPGQYTSPEYQQRQMSWLSYGLKNETDTRWLKVVERVKQDPGEARQAAKKGGAQNKPHERALGIANWGIRLRHCTLEEVKKEHAISPLTEEDVPGINVDAHNTFFGGIVSSRHREALCQPHLFLGLLIVHPDYQGKGIGRKLTQWGCDRADAAGLPAYLEASMQGAHLYPKLGFETIRLMHYDLAQWGGEGTEISTVMERPARIIMPGQTNAVPKDVEGLKKGEATVEDITAKTGMVVTG